jgi:hypothetical protein
MAAGEIHDLAAALKSLLVRYDNLWQSVVPVCVDHCIRRPRMETTTPAFTSTSSVIRLFASRTC